MKSTTVLLIGIVIVIIIGIIGGYFYHKHNSIPSYTISFPKGGETLVPGKHYTLKWNDADTMSTTTNIFLIDNDLESQGESVSIADRVYAVPDNGSYDYTVPTTTPVGTYHFEIGTLSSNAFMIAG